MVTRFYLVKRLRSNVKSRGLGKSTEPENFTRVIRVTVIEPPPPS